MKRSLSVVIMLSLVALLNGCIVTKSPGTALVVVLRGSQQTFQVTVFPPGASFTWTLDSTPVAGQRRSYQYTPTGGQHSLTMTATHILGTDKQTWTVIDAEAAQSVDETGGTVAVTDPASPLAGAQAVIPAGALTSATTVWICNAFAPAGLPGQAAGPCVEFGPEGTQFAVPVDLYFPYADADNDGMVDGTGIPEDQVKAWYYNGVTSAWEEVPVLDRDPVNNRVQIQATHFSIFATDVPLTWNKTYGGSGNDGAWSIKQTSDGGYIVAGFTDYYVVDDGDTWLIKTDANGDEEWNKTYEGGGAFSVQKTSDGGYFIGGIFPGSTIIKTDAYGNKEWEKEGGSFIVLSSQQTSDRGYILAGFKESNQKLTAYLCKTDEQGNEQWNKIVGNGVAWSVQQTSDGGFIVVAYDMIKTDANGNVEWYKAFGGTMWSVQQTSDGGYILAGNMGNHACLIKTDANGDEEWNKTFCCASGPVFFFMGYMPWSVQQTSDGGYIVAGCNDSYGAGGLDAWLIKTDACGNAPDTPTPG